MLDLGGLFLAAFLSATLLPGSSEAALAGLLATGRIGVAEGIAVATVGNTLGSCANWAIGRFLEHWKDHPRFPVTPAQFEKACAWYGRWGVWSLLLSWAPIIGDPLTVIAGVFRTPFWLFALVVGSAKLVRYLAVAGLVRLVW
jgi:membrane protein YqaA with SNARE-associated domain